MKQAGVKNPVFLLDEIDKMTADMRGDPSSALLEVLDPEQNHTFSDHFLELPFDLSKVFWITTANVLSNIPRPLMDRMEIIDFTSYTEDEKVQIAKKYLVPKQIKENGLKASQAKFSDAVLRRIISGYTRESGVRRLEKMIGTVCRRIGKSLLMNDEVPLSVSVKNLEKLLGPVKFLPDTVHKDDEVGIVTGMAWTQSAVKSWKRKPSPSKAGTLDAHGTTRQRYERIGRSRRHLYPQPCRSLRSGRRFLYQDRIFTSTCRRGHPERRSVCRDYHGYGHYIGPDGKAVRHDVGHDR